MQGAAVRGRLSTFSNEDLMRRIEEHGGEGWLSDVAERQSIPE